jgi:hypothetical protein
VGHVRGDAVVIQDADLEYDPREIVGLVAPIASGGVSAVFGSRFASKRRGSRRSYLLNRAFNWLLTRVCNTLTRRDMTDVAGGYKAFRRDVFQALPFRENGFACDTEIAVHLGCCGVAVAEVPISYNPRTYAEGKKIRARDGLRALWVALRTWHTLRGVPPPPTPNWSEASHTSTPAAQERLLIQSPS